MQTKKSSNSAKNRLCFVGDVFMYRHAEKGAFYFVEKILILKSRKAFELSYIFSIFILEAFF